MLANKTILHPTDLSAAADRAFQLAASLAREYDARLIVLHVVCLPAVMYGPPPESYLDHLLEELRRQRPSDPTVRVQNLLVEGAPAAAILRAARETACDLIVMGTRGRAGLGRLLLGSVAEGVVRRACCPVLTVRGPQAQRLPGGVSAPTERESAAAAESLGDLVLFLKEKQVGSSLNDMGRGGKAQSDIKEGARP
jgi:nucleotide-binding universal stress UspA family protein